MSHDSTRKGSPSVPDKGQASCGHTKSMHAFFGAGEGLVGTVEIVPATAGSGLKKSLPTLRRAQPAAADPPATQDDDTSPPPETPHQNAVVVISIAIVSGGLNEVWFKNERFKLVLGQPPTKKLTSAITLYTKHDFWGGEQRGAALR